MKLTEHHIVPRSKGGSNDQINKVKLYEGPHVNHHRIFGNDTPLEQIKRIIEFNQKALTEKTIRDLINSINYQDEQYFYKDGVWRR